VGAFENAIGAKLEEDVVLNCGEHMTIQGFGDILRQYSWRSHPVAGRYRLAQERLDLTTNPSRWLSIEAGRKYILTIEGKGHCLGVNDGNIFDSAGLFPFGIRVVYKEEGFLYKDDYIDALGLDITTGDGINFVHRIIDQKLRS
jgi:hypothetical protein